MSTPREKTAEIIVQVLLRHLSGEKPENGEQQTGIPPERMPNNTRTY